MIEVAVMIEGQNGLNWERWQRMAKVVEERGFVGLYRSDHFTNADPPDKDSLELWISLAWLASNTKRLEFGPLVSPLSFRNPAITARMASSVDDLSGGRLTLGLGAGWQEREHANFGFDLLPIPQRFERFREGVEVVSRLLHNDTPVSYTGKYYHLHEAVLLPRPKRPGGPPILIGGNGPERTLPLVAQFAAEWNAVMIPPDEFSRLNEHLDDLLTANGRRPEDVRRSMMTGCIFGRDAGEVRSKVETRSQGKRSADELRARGMVVGTGAEIVNQLRRLDAVGVQRVMLQWIELDEIDALEQMAHEILSQL